MRTLKRERLEIFLSKLQLGYHLTHKIVVEFI